MRWTLPNILTVFRLLATPLVPIAFLYFTRPLADWVALVIFSLAAITDYLDGYLARLWKQQSRFGAMLDPIADKAMVIIALLVISGFSGMNPWLLLPATAIIFREVFVSGLREFIADKSAQLKVTQIAKWKTTVQMIAIAVMFSAGIFEHFLVMQSEGMDQAMFEAVISGREQDVLGLRWKYDGMNITWNGGVVLLWVAAAMTLYTGWDYLMKSMPYLRDKGPEA